MRSLINILIVSILICMALLIFCINALKHLFLVHGRVAEMHHVLISQFSTLYAVALIILSLNLKHHHLELRRTNDAFQLLYTMPIQTDLSLFKFVSTPSVITRKLFHNTFSMFSSHNTLCCVFEFSHKIEK